MFRVITDCICLFTVTTAHEASLEFSNQVTPRKNIRQCVDREQRLTIIIGAKPARLGDQARQAPPDEAMNKCVMK